jgi:kumamolisin
VYGVTEQFLDAIRQPHKAVSRASILRNGEVAVANVPIVSGSVEVDANSQVRRSCDITLGAAVDVYGSEIAVYRGVEFTDGSTEMVPLGVFRVDQRENDVVASLPVHVTSPDRAKALADAKFFSPIPSTVGAAVATTIIALARGALPDVQVINASTAIDTVPRATWEDRWQAITECAVAIGADVFFDPNGALVIRDEPTLADQAVFTVDAGPTGVLIGGTATTSRDGVFNAVVMSGERADGSTPARWVVTNDDPSSPTFYGGPFGRIPGFFSNPLITSNDQARRAGLAQLARVSGAARVLSLNAVPNPALDAGDVITVRLPDGTTERHLIDRLTIPLGASDGMTLTTRSTVPTENAA